jgi:hypothetical protein
MTEVMQVTTWFTRPGWTRAHELEVESTMGAATYWVTYCGREYPLEDPYFDRPTQAPDGMARCLNCVFIEKGTTDGQVHCPSDAGS